MAYKQCNCKREEPSVFKHHEHGHHEHDSHAHDHQEVGCHEHGHHHDGHSHHHHHDNGSLRGQLWLIGISAVLLVAAVIIERSCPWLSTWQLLLVYLVPYLLAGHGTLINAMRGIAQGDMFNEHFLMSVATIGALLIGFMPHAEREFAEAVFVMLFFLVGEMFEGYAEGQSRKSIAQLMNIRPDVAHLQKSGTLQGEAAVTDVSPESVAVGSIIVIRPGEKVPLDGVVIEGASSLDTAALTGESVPRDVGVADKVLSGCINLSGVVKVRTTKGYGESTVAKIIRLVENASEHKSHSEAFITRFARVYTPIVVYAAIALAVLPPLAIFLATQLSPLATIPIWLHRALIFLVVSCPCALVISVPLTFFGGIGGASRNGILVKGANFMDVLAKVDTVVFDKTGTLTQGQFAVTAIHSEDPDILHLAAHVEHHSTHPIGAALRDAFPDESTDGCEVSDVVEIAGQGVKAKVTFKPKRAEASNRSAEVYVGNEKMMEAVGAKWTNCKHDNGTVIHVAIDGEYAGHIVTGDTVKADSAEAIRLLQQMGVKRTVMLTGDRTDVASVVAKKLGIEEWHAGLLPDDKAAFIDHLHNDVGPGTKEMPTVAFVGDGINDAPVLARADVGVAMGGLGSDAAIEAADIVVMDDKPSKVALAIAVARRTIRIARENVIMAIGIKIAVLLLATIGMATMWMAVFADVGVTVLAVINAMRAMTTVSLGTRQSVRTSK